MINVGITCGDINGIGPEIALKSVSKFKKDVKFHFIGPKVVFMNLLSGFPQDLAGKIEFVDIGKGNQNIGTPTKASGQIALEAIHTSIELWKNKTIDLVVTAPISKEAIMKAGSKFTGHTEIFADAFNTKNFAMMFLSRKFFSALVTIHLPVKEIASAFSAEILERKLKVIRDSMINDFKCRALKIAVLGLNPHSGENDTLGFEENKIIKPVLNKLNEDRKYFDGPFPSDGYFGQKTYKKYDCTVGMYHDQALIPFKLLNFNEGVNFTAGLPIVRTSPDHGTAFSLAGKNLANPKSMIEAIRFGIKIYKNRKK